MRIILVIALAFCSGCSNDSPDPESVPVYDPSTFRTTVSTLVDNNRYSAAVKYLRAAEPKRQAAFDKTGFYAVGEDLIVLPGVKDSIHYDRNRDWFIPHTSDVILHEEWQNAATEFAKAYNTVRNAE